MMAQLTESYQQRLESLLSVDEGLQRIYSAVQESGELDNTIFLFTSDNGYMMGEHRVHAGKTIPYNPSARVPLILKGPGVPAGTARQQSVSTLDMTSTILEMAEATPTVEQDGKSLVPLLAADTTDPTRIMLIEAGPQTTNESDPWFYRGVRTNEWLYVRYERTGEVEMYDLVNDPYHLRNVAANPTYLTQRTFLNAELERLKNCSGANCQ